MSDKCAILNRPHLVFMTALGAYLAIVYVANSFKWGRRSKGCLSLGPLRILTGRLDNASQKWYHDTHMDV